MAPLRTLLVLGLALLSDAAWGGAKKKEKAKVSQPRRAPCCCRTRALRRTRGPPCGWIARGGASFRCSATVLTACCRSSPSCTLASSTGHLCVRRRRRTETASLFTVRPGGLCDGARRGVTAPFAESAGARGTDGERVNSCCSRRSAGLCFGGVCSPCGGTASAPPLASPHSVLRASLPASSASDCEHATPQTAERCWTAALSSTPATTATSPLISCWDRAA